MKKNQIIFILYLIASLLVTFLIAHSLCSQTQPEPRLVQSELTLSPTQSLHDTLRIIGDAVNRGIFYRESYFIQLKISERLYNDFESLYKQNRHYLNLLDSLSRIAVVKPNYLPAILVTTGIVSAVWSLLIFLSK
jgi:uncharacterized membrane protein